MLQSSINKGHTYLLAQKLDKTYIRGRTQRSISNWAQTFYQVAFESSGHFFNLVIYFLDISKSLIHYIFVDVLYSKRQTERCGCLWEKFIFIYDIHQMALDFESHTYKHTLKKSTWQQIYDHNVTLKCHKNMWPSKRTGLLSSYQIFWNNLGVLQNYWWNFVKSYENSNATL